MRPGRSDRARPAVRAAVTGLAAGLLLQAGCGARPGEPLPQAALPASVEATIYLVGDAGEPDPRFAPVLEALKADLAGAGSGRLVVYLGDNIYPKGMPPDSLSRERAEAERRLRAQLEAALDGGADVVLIPGNHDWNYAGGDGRARVVAQERYGLSIGRGRTAFLPGGACPGPAVRDIGTHVRLVALDTQWWLTDPPSPAEAGGCAVTMADVTDSLRAVLAGAGHRSVVVVGHHPLVTNGPHGGHFTLKQHIFPLTELKGWLWLPLPVLGSLYPLARKLGISDQDVSGGRYRRMRDSLSAAFSAHPTLVYATGHEHALQVLKGDGSAYQIVSGTGIFDHVSPVRRSGDTFFAAPGKSGFMKLHIGRDGRIVLSVVVVDAAANRSVPFRIQLE